MEYIKRAIEDQVIKDLLSKNKVILIMVSEMPLFQTSIRLTHGMISANCGKITLSVSV